MWRFESSSGHHHFLRYRSRRCARCLSAGAVRGQSSRPHHLSVLHSPIRSNIPTQSTKSARITVQRGSMSCVGIRSCWYFCWYRSALWRFSKLDTNNRAKPYASQRYSVARTKRGEAKVVIAEGQDPSAVNEDAPLVMARCRTTDEDGEQGADSQRREFQRTLIRKSTPTEVKEQLSKWSLRLMFRHRPKR